MAKTDILRHVSSHGDAVSSSIYSPKDFHSNVHVGGYCPFRMDENNCFSSFGGRNDIAAFGHHDNQLSPGIPSKLRSGLASGLRERTLGFGLVELPCWSVSSLGLSR